MRAFAIDAAAQIDLLAATVWYEDQREGLGDELVAAVEIAFRRVRDTEEFVTAPVLRLATTVIRRERTRRFESDRARRVIGVLHRRRDPNVWRARF